jgi:hypothetical protein
MQLASLAGLGGTSNARTTDSLPAILPHCVGHFWLIVTCRVTFAGAWLDVCRLFCFPRLASCHPFVTCCSRVHLKRAVLWCVFVMSSTLGVAHITPCFEYCYRGSRTTAHRTTEAVCGVALFDHKYCHPSIRSSGHQLRLHAPCRAFSWVLSSSSASQLVKRRHESGLVGAAD